MEIIIVNNRTEELIEQLVKLWEESVTDTHHFLTAEGIAEIKQYVPQAIKNVAQLTIAVDNNHCPVAFMGVESSKLEMLFIHPNHTHKGLGRKLIEFGIKNFGINEVTVNEQNPDAVGFYQHIGFTTYKRTDCDEAGMPYPLLYMKL